MLGTNEDGTLTVHWDEYGSVFDCRMDRRELIVDTTALAQKSLTTGKPTVRTWRDSTGKFSIKAILLRQSSGSVTLKTEGGREVTLAIDRLSQEDQKYLRQHATSPVNPFE